MTPEYSPREDPELPVLEIQPLNIQRTDKFSKSKHVG